LFPGLDTRYNRRSTIHSIVCVFFFSELSTRPKVFFVEEITTKQKSIFTQFHLSKNRTSGDRGLFYIIKSLNTKQQQEQQQHYTQKNKFERR
jgi:hypothetical protein